MGKLVSIIMATYNETDQELSESIESILNQTYKNFELIIVNDNPENTKLKNKINQYLSDSRIVLIENQTNIGAAKSRTKAVIASSGYYTAILDADDVSLPNRLEKQIDYLENHPECDLVACCRNNINSKSEIIKVNASKKVSDAYIPLIMKYCSIITHSTVFLKTELLKQINGYRPFPSGHDYDMLLRLLSQGKKFHIMSESLVNYRIRSNSITNANYSKQYYCDKYIRKLYKERLNNNKDSFNVSILNNILTSHTTAATAIDNQYKLMNQILQKRQLLSNLFKFIRDLFYYPENLINLINKVRIQIFLLLLNYK